MSSGKKNIYKLIMWLEQALFPNILHMHVTYIPFIIKLHYATSQPGGANYSQIVNLDGQEVQKNSIDEMFGTKIMPLDYSVGNIQATNCICTTLE